MAAGSIHTISQQERMRSDALYYKNRAGSSIASGKTNRSSASQIVSKTLVQNRAVSLTLFAFDQGEEIATHDSSGDAMVQILEGTAQFAVDGKIHVCKAGDVLIMPAKKPHSVYAPEAFKMLLTVIFPLEDHSIL